MFRPARGRSKNGLLSAPARRRFLIAALGYAATTLQPATLHAGRHPLKLRGTTWDQVALEFGLDPWLLYAIAIVESRRSQLGHMVSPWPWALSSPEGSWYGRNRIELLTALLEVLDAYDHERIDVGLMQINVGWHRARVEDVSDLTYPETNLRVAASILREAVVSAPEDPLLGVGRYHSWTPSVARRYGARVMRVYHQIYDYEEVHRQGEEVDDSR